MSQKRGTLFSEKSFLCFQGCPFLRHVPKPGFFIFWKQSWSFLGDALCAILGHFGRFWAILEHFGAFWGILCPKNGVPCFRKKAFAIFRGCSFLRNVPKTGYLVFGKQLWLFSGGAIALFIVAFIRIKLHPRIIVCGAVVVVTVLGVLPSGNCMRCCKRHLSAQREYHGRSSICS